MAASSAEPGPSAGETERLARVLDRLRREAGASGFLRFDRFLEIALYADGIGYYTRPGMRLGRGGDFYTAAHVSPLFGAALAQRILAEFARLGQPESFRVVELGPGDGTLAADTLTALARDPGVEAGDLEYDVVERSPSLANLLRERLSLGERPSGVRLRFVPSLASVGPMVGVVFANEFFDALPFRRVVARGDRFNELGVAVRATGVEWAETPLGGPIPGPALPSGLEEGTVLEVSPIAEALIREIGDHLVDGAAILLDYGDEESELVHRYPRGTLAAYRHHRAIDAPLDSPGASDLSAHVNFSRIRSAAGRAGLTEVAFESQARALGRWGFPSLQEAARRGLARDEEKVRVALQAKNLLFGFQNFRVLELGPGGRSSAP